MAYTKLFQSIITSSVWGEKDQTRLVWITMLALADKHGEVQASIAGLARVACVSIKDCEAAIQSFLSPDVYSRTKDDEGRRVEEIDGGWHLLNYDKYRKMASKADALEKAAVRQSRFREKKKRNAPVTHSHKSVTHERDIAEAEAEAEAKEEIKPREEAANAALLKNVFLGTVSAGLCKRRGIKTLPNEREWHQKLLWAFANGFTAESVLECYDLLTAQDFWKGKTISPKTLIENLSNLSSLRNQGNGSSPKLRTLAEIQKDKDEAGKYLRKASESTI